jgi:hypothetical protein
VLAAALGGGGHEQAASAIARLGLDEARAVSSMRSGRRSVSRVAPAMMSTLPRAVAPDDTVRAAMMLCQRHGQSGVFVVADRGSSAA